MIDQETADLVAKQSAHIARLTHQVNLLRRALIIQTFKPLDDTSIARGPMPGSGIRFIGESLEKDPITQGEYVLVWPASMTYFDLIHKDNPSL